MANFRISRARDLDLDLGSGHTAYHHAKSLWTDGRTDIWDTNKHTHTQLVGMTEPCPRSTINRTASCSLPMVTHMIIHRHVTYRVDSDSLTTYDAVVITLLIVSTVRDFRYRYRYRSVDDTHWPCAGDLSHPRYRNHSWSARLSQGQGYTQSTATILSPAEINGKNWPVYHHV